ncbi:acyltransferase family protein [Arthrobacter gengyunqii]|uniref:Acyltransferase family protein n=1 Tax=Arthrobacter gengyunqii TaxID=2886940 RepID=A0ABS8GJ25_9MICC|nr:acyltransferase family protein [Arthrobacter gengyunqii]MCC3266565.1 acyltransferase family protein [Arthrobacter gengyunqii]
MTDGKPANHRAASVGIAQTLPERLPWPDLARGICVILVVAMHIYEVHYTAWLADAPLSKAWDIVVSAAQPIRMPLFFLISGYLCANSIYRPWRAVMRKRIFSIVYLYYVWLGLYAFVAFGETLAQEVAFTPEAFIRQLFWPSTSLWYLYGLVAYFLIARATSRIPPWALILITAVISVAGTTAFDGTLQYLSRCLFFFVIGCRWPQIVRTITINAHWRTATAALAGYAVACIFALWAGQKTLGVAMVTSIVGLYLALQLATLIGPHKISKPFQFIGRNTLAIFVLHPILLKTINLIFEANPSIVSWIRAQTLIAASYPLMLTASLVTLCLLIEKGATTCHAAFLFRMPQHPTTQLK